MRENNKTKYINEVFFNKNSPFQKSFTKLLIFSQPTKKMKAKKEIAAFIRLSMPHILKYHLLHTTHKRYQLSVFPLYALCFYTILNW